MTNNKLNLNQPSSFDDSGKIERKMIKAELLHQAHLSFLAIRGFILASVFVYILGVGSFLAGKVPEGRITTANESISKILFVLVKLDKQNNDRLDRLAKEFKDDD